MLADLEQRRVDEAQQPFNDYVGVLVNGVSDKSDVIDERISMASIGWDLDRMPGVDRNALRIGVWELLWGSGVPGEVAISEAVGTVEELSTDESPAFVNGVLSSVMASRT